MTKIINIYQERYNNYKMNIGFGDFLRGCFFLIQYTKMKNYDYEIYINTPINIFLKNFKKNDEIKKIENKINYFTEQNTNFSDENLPNLNNFYEYNNFIKKFEMFCTNNIYSDNNIYLLTNAYPVHNISDYERNILKSIIEPSDEMKIYIESTIQQLNLKKYNFEVIHVRSGDSFLINKMDISSIKKNIENRINNIIDVAKEYLLISDSNDLNIYITNTLGNIKTIYNNKCHLGDINNDLVNIKNTLLDFYMMSYSNKITSFSVYGHGTSFSKWCAEIYNITNVAFKL